MSHSLALKGIAAATLLACALPAAIAAGYQQPPANILKVMRAPSLPGPSLSPTQDNMLLVAWQEYPSIARVAAPYLKLAGTGSNRPTAASTTRRAATASPRARKASSW